MSKRTTALAAPKHRIIRITDRKTGLLLMRCRFPIAFLNLVEKAAAQLRCTPSQIFERAIRKDLRRAGITINPRGGGR